MLMYQNVKFEISHFQLNCQIVIGYMHIVKKRIIYNTPLSKHFRMMIKFINMLLILIRLNL